jgi:hypothetical protein
VGEIADVAIVEVLPAGKDAAEQDGGVDGGDLGVPDAFAGADVGEVIEEAAMRGQFLPEEDEGCEHALASFLMRDETALFRDADGGETEAGGGDAGDHAGVDDAHVAAVFDQSGLGIGLLPEVEEVGALEVVEKLIIVRGKSGWRGGGMAAVGWGELCEDRMSRGRGHRSGRALRGGSGAAGEGRLDCEFVPGKLYPLRSDYRSFSFRPSEFSPEFLSAGYLRRIG